MSSSLEGRGRYLCAARAASEAKIVSRDSAALIKKLFREIAKDGSAPMGGLRDELPLSIPDWLWERICSDPDACKALDCSPAKCAYMDARARARTARIVIVNHHILLADATIKNRSGVSWGRKSAGPDDRENLAVLGPYRHLIVDEAHALESAAEAFGERKVTVRGIQALATRMKRLPDSGTAINRLAECLLEVQKVIRELPPNSLIAPMGDGDGPILGAAVLSARAAARATRDCAETFDEGVLADVLAEQCSSLAAKLEAIDLALRFGEDDLGPRAPSADEGALTSQLVDAGPWLRDYVWDQVPAVLMSGTLRVPGCEGFVTGRVGLGGLPVIDLPSVFDHRAQRLVYVTPRADRGGGARCDADDVRELLGLVEASDGRALVLFPAMQDLKFMYEQIRGRTPHMVLGQGITPAEDQPSRVRSAFPIPMPNHRLAELFHGDRHSILLATRSFFQGSDFPGDTCSLVVIARYPNVRPDDPLVLARRMSIERAGGNPWREYQEPSMLMLFQQAAGRAIRRLDDRGVVAVLDPRSGSKAYAKRALLSLLPSDFTDSLADVEQFLQ